METVLQVAGRLEGDGAVEGAAGWWEPVGVRPQSRGKGDQEGEGRWSYLASS